MLASDIAGEIGGVLEGRDVEIVACAGLEEARKGDLSFCKDPKHAALVLSTKASAVLLPRDWEGVPPCAVIRVRNPDEACIKAATMLAPPPPVREPGIHPTAVVDPTARLGRRVHVGALAVIERGAEIGDDCVIEAQSFVGENCRLGRECHVYPQVTIREGSVLGKGVILHCGVRIGGDGYGYTTSVGITGIRIEKIPQLGIVEIGDGVEVGSNTTIDRARIGRTYIGPQTKIDNLVQVGHNVKIAGYSGLIAQSGVAGSTQIGKGCLVWAQAGVSGHIKIADGVQVGPQAGVPKSLDGSVKYVIGAPAESKKDFGARLLLPRIVEKLKAEVRELKAQVATLRGMGAAGVAAVALTLSCASPLQSEAAEPELPARLSSITSDTAYYDRKEGMAVFTGHVRVDDGRCQMHADKAYVFLSGTNSLKRVVAIGNVALTNDMKVAYGEKAAYYKESGMVVLYGGQERSAEVVDLSKGQKQSLSGSKIKFWTNSEQVEVVGATIVAPASAKGGVSGAADLLR